jgi:hypothetical protein
MFIGSAKTVKPWSNDKNESNKAAILHFPAG